MRRYRHYSFDLWSTLIRSNPEFKVQRDSLFFERYNPKGLSLEEVRLKIREIDVQSSSLCDKVGMHNPVELIVGTILTKIGYKPVDPDVIATIVGNIQALFLTYLPFPYDSDTKSVLETLKDSGCTINILSNTGFITGETLRAALAEIGLLDCFDAEIFSDEEHISKPNPIMFKRICAAFPECHGYIKTGEILHVGDNPVADGGSVRVGIPYFQINSNDRTIKDLL